MMRLLVAGSLLIGAVAITGCDRNIEPFVPGEEPREPDLSKIFPAGAEKSRRNEEARLAGQPAPGGGRGAPPVASAAAPLRGTVSIAAGLRDRLPGESVLFLIARNTPAGPPLAVRRIPAPSFPLDFEIGPEHRMIQSLPFAGELMVTARLDGDGNATTRNPGDLQGAADGTFYPGATDITVVLDEIL